MRENVQRSVNRDRSRFRSASCWSPAAGVDRFEPVRAAREHGARSETNDAKAASPKSIRDPPGGLVRITCGKSASSAPSSTAHDARGNRLATRRVRSRHGCHGRRLRADCRFGPPRNRSRDDRRGRGTGTVLAAWHQSVLRWPALVALLISIMLFVPIGRYSIPVDLPFGLELYRVAVAAVLAAWAGALLVDAKRSAAPKSLRVPDPSSSSARRLGHSRLTCRRGRSARARGAEVDHLFSSASYCSPLARLLVVRRRRTVETPTKLLAAGTLAVVAALSIAEQRVSFNIFDHVGGLSISAFNGAVEGRPLWPDPCGGIVGASDRAGVLIAMASRSGSA